MTDPLAALRKGRTNNKGAQANTNQNNDIQAGIDYVKANGGDPKQAAIKLCKEMGLPIPTDPIALANQLLHLH